MASAPCAACKAEAALPTLLTSHGREIDLPREICIRNTFLETTDMSPWLAERKERHCKTCPGLAHHAAYEEEEEEEEASICKVIVSLAGACSTCATPPASATSSASSSRAPPVFMAPVHSAAMMPMGVTMVPYVPGLPYLMMPLPMQQAGPAPSTPAVPEPPAPAMPSVGSRAHHKGRCRPCGFLHGRGCTSGASCKFCHLCDRSECSRDRRSKQAMAQSIRKAKMLIFAGVKEGPHHMK